MNVDREEQAQRVSELVDGILLHHRYDGASDPPATDGELRELGTLARSLSEVAISVPEDFRDQLANRLPQMAKIETEHDRADDGRDVLRGWVVAARVSVRRLLEVRVPPRFSAVSSALAIALFTIVMFRALVDAPVASAAEILSRSDAAMATLVGRGQLLYREWKVSSRTVAPDGREISRGNTRLIREWMDGGDFDRVAARWYSGDDRLLIAYSSVASGGQRRPHAYFSPGVYGEVRGVLNVEPTAEEYKEATARFPNDLRRALTVYLDRQYIYLPITGERRFNKAILKPEADIPPSLPRIVVSSDSTEINGTAAYRVRVVDPAAITFNWRSEGPPRVRAGSAEIVRYIARDSYLSVRSDETFQYVDGTTRFTTRELVETRAVNVEGSPLDPFKLDVPEGTPVHLQSAFDQLSGVAAAYATLARPTSTSIIDPPSPLTPRTDLAAPTPTLYSATQFVLHR